MATATGPAPPAVKLTYFPIEGAGEKIRLALKLSGVDFEDERIGGAAWQERKASTKYGQMPILTVDGVEKYQSTAQLKYVARRFNPALYPSDDIEAQFKIDEAICLVEDLQRLWQPCFYVSMYPARFGHPADISDEAKGAIIQPMRERFVAESLPQMMGFVKQMLADNGGAFLAGPNVTIADCVAVPQLRFFMRGVADHVPVTCLDEHTEVVEYINRFMAIPEIAAHYAPAAPST